MFVELHVSTSTTATSNGPALESQVAKFCVFKSLATVQIFEASGISFRGHYGTVRKVSVRSCTFGCRTIKCVKIHGKFNRKSKVVNTNCCKTEFKF